MLIPYICLCIYTFCFCSARFGHLLPRLLPFNTTFVDLKLGNNKKYRKKNPRHLSFNKGHYGSVHQLVHVRHIHHLARKLAYYQSAMKHITSTQFLQTNFSIQPLAGMILHYTNFPLPSHEQMFLNLTVKSLLEQSSHPGLQNYLNGIHDKHLNRHELSNFIYKKELVESARKQRYQCYEQVSFFRQSSTHSSHPGDLTPYRRIAYKMLNLSSSLTSNCPPRRAIFLQRSNRQILNAQDLAQLIKKDFDIDFEIVSVPGKNSSEHVDNI
jgi:hypothetical protein